MSEIPEAYLEKARLVVSSARPQENLAHVIARALMVAVEAERERCAAAVEKRAVELGRQECCGFGLGSPPECCADPLYMISNVEAATTIRAVTEA